MKTYQEIKETAFELFGSSSAKKEEWLEEYTAYINGEYNTIWNDPDFMTWTGWTEENKKECLDIIILLYDKKERS